MTGPIFQVELRLPAKVPGVVEEAHGWFLHMTDARAWIRFASRLAEAVGRQPEALSLYVVNDEGGTVAGLLIPMSEPLDRRSIERLRAPDVEPLTRRCSSASLLLPVDAWLEPPLSEAEIESVFPLPVELFHPRVGRVAFELHEAIGLASLVRASGPPRPSRWTTAVAGTVLPARIGPVLSVVGEEDVEVFYDDFSEEIGRGDREELPEEAFRPPRDPRDQASAGEARSKAVGGRSPFRWTKSIARRVLRWTQSVDASAERDTWVNRLENWAAGVLDRAESHRGGAAVQWLLNKLDEDPDEGLRYAVPLGGDRRGGRVETSSGLAKHGTDFKLGELGVRRGTSILGADHHQVLKLEAAYREQANLAIERGDVRRAAFIHAHLLHDLRMAALVLERGGYYREAAALWQERLLEPRGAARCLAAGGFVDEAVRLYVSVGAHAEAATALEEVGHGEAAVPHWESAVEAATKLGDVCGAVTLVKERLGQPERAASLAFNGWTGDPARVDCLGLWLDLKAELGCLDEVSAWASSEDEAGLRARIRRGDAGRLFREVARFTARASEDDAARNTVEDLGDELRLSAAMHLGGMAGVAGSTAAAQAEILDALRELQPDERVWSRDLSSLKRSIRSEAVRPIREPEGGVLTISQIRRVQLMPEPGSEGPYALHHSRAGLILARSVKRTRTLLLELIDGKGVRLARVAWTNLAAGNDGEIESLQVISVPRDPLRLFLLVRGEGGRVVRLVPKELVGKGGSTLTVSSAPWWPDVVLAVFADSSHQWLALPADSGGVLIRALDIDDAAEPVRDFMLPSLDPAEPLFIGSLGSSIYVLQGDSIHGVTDGPRAALLPHLGESILSVATSPPRSLGRMILRTATRAMLLTMPDGVKGDARGSAFELLTLAAGEGARAAFLPTGTIVAATETHDRAFQTHQRQVQKLAERLRAGGELGAVALVGTSQPTSYLALDAVGAITLLRFKRD